MPYENVLSSRYYGLCAVSLLSGDVRCWGYIDRVGSLAPILVPTSVASSTVRVKAVSVGAYGVTVIDNVNITTNWDVGWFSYGGARNSVQTVCQGGDPWTAGITHSGAVTYWGG